MARTRATRRTESHLPYMWMMRDAREAYRKAIAGALAGGGFSDLPRSGVLVLADLGVAPRRSGFRPQSDVIASQRLSKQAASQLIDTLVLRGYLERRPDPEDRRRMEVMLTGRGWTAAGTILRAIESVDVAVEAALTTDQRDGLRSGLAAYRNVNKGTPHVP